MDEYINKQQLLKKAKEHQSNIFGIPLIIAEIENAEGIQMKKGSWVVNPDSFDGWKHHMCSVCKKDAVFEYRYVSDYDEGFDGEWEYVGKREAGINEILTDYCPHCGTCLKE